MLSSELYRDHYRKKMGQNLKNAYPLTYHLLKNTHWQEMVDQFLAEGECTSPYFWKVPKTFLQFAKKKEFATRYEIPYLEDLLDFEWLEIELYMMPDQPGREGWIVMYSYPVFEKKPLPRPMEKGKYFLYAFRHPISKEVKFIQLTPFYCRVHEWMDEVGEEGAIVKAAEEFQIDLSKALSKGRQFLKQLE
ncbi:MAG: putative DNA-binding domain-containing protein [Verrucomicrobia bacterium]|nr:putative DNA-binding domain-containing protein [Verrucomicrobiota bacterium]